ncbi:cytochrome b [Paraburkholderia strydomiana]|uniref:Cytochrome b n=1 Tax=Paraburkholderia strydomiana TaxID=1245417 RepID=A0ABW9ERL9_9BURK
MATPESLSDPGPEDMELNQRLTYEPAQKFFHWAMAIVVLSAIALGLWSSFLVPGDPLRKALLDLHKSFGFTAAALILPRIICRLMSRASVGQPEPNRLFRLAAHGTHFGLYALMILMPVTGYLFSAAGGYSLPWFGLFHWPRLVDESKAMSLAGKWLHDKGAWLIYAAVSAHILAVIWHSVFRRDDVLWRMLPDWRSDDETPD